jgi:hypothetical protein
VEQEIAPVCLDPVTGLIEKKGKRLQKTVKGMSPSVTRMRDPLNQYGRGCDTAGYGSCRTMGGPWNNRSRHMISLSVTYRHLAADENGTRSILQRS